MGIQGYDKFFLHDVMDNLGFATDFAVNGCGIAPDSFYDFFIISKVARQIETNSPVFICGCSGTELALTVFERVGFDAVIPDMPFGFERFNRTPEYWAGWITAFYQWKRGLSFSRIRDFVPFHDIINMYYPLHEAPEEKFLGVMDEIIKKKERSAVSYSARRRTS
ncbi:MAG: hypothetical protein IJU95_00065 [Treponema sp.]|nr:hypothetical protein [Treponema sp.]